MGSTKALCKEKTPWGKKGLTPDKPGTQKIKGPKATLRNRPKWQEDQNKREDNWKPLTVVTGDVQKYSEGRKPIGVETQLGNRYLSKLLLQVGHLNG